MNVGVRGAIVVRLHSQHKAGGSFLLVLRVNTKRVLSVRFFSAQDPTVAGHHVPAVRMTRVFIESCAVLRRYESWSSTRGP